MREVIWMDEHGYKHRSLARDGDSDEDAARVGVRQDPPDLGLLDWEGIKRDLHNLLVERGLTTWRDVQASGKGVSNALLTVMKRRIINLYKLQDKAEG